MLAMPGTAQPVQGPPRAQETHPLTGREPIALATMKRLTVSTSDFVPHLILLSFAISEDS